VLPRRSYSSQKRYVCKSEFFLDHPVKKDPVPASAKMRVKHDVNGKDCWRPPRIHPPHRAQARSRHGHHPLAPQPLPPALRLRSAPRAKESVFALTSHGESTYLKGYGKIRIVSPFSVQSYVRLVFPAPGCVAAMLLRRTFVDEDREIPSARACRVLPDCPRHLSAQNSSLIISSSPKAYFREYEFLTCRLR
jgi:hypothetical protein